MRDGKKGQSIGGMGVKDRQVGGEVWKPYA